MIDQRKRLESTKAMDEILTFPNLLPIVKRQLIEKFEFGIHRRELRRYYGIRQEDLDNILREGIRILRSQSIGQLDFRNGFGRRVRKPMGKAEVVQMPVRKVGEAA